MKETDWKQVGVILYTDNHEIPRFKIITGEHTYEVQACKFHLFMKVFSVLVDGEFHPSIYDSFDRFMKLDEVSKSNKCSEREQELSNEICVMSAEIVNLNKELDRLRVKYNDARVVIFDGV